MMLNFVVALLFLSVFVSPCCLFPAAMATPISHKGAIKV